MYLLLALTYPFARCTFGYSLAIEWVSSWLLKTRVADVNSFLSMFNTLVVKILLVLRLRAIWNKNLIGERARNMSQWTHYFFWNVVTLILYFMTAGMFCRIWFLIDRNHWWLKLAEILVHLKQYDTEPTNWLYFSVQDVCDHIWHICWVSCRSASPSPWLLDEWNAPGCYME